MQLEGKVNGIDIILYWLKDNIYSTIIPKQITGIYIIQLQLVLDDGYANNYSNVFVRIDFQKMKVEFLDQSYVWHEGKDESYGFKEIDIFCTWHEESDENYSYKETQSPYAYWEVL